MFFRTSLSVTLFGAVIAAGTQRKASFDPVADPKMNAILSKIDQEIQDLANTEIVPPLRGSPIDIPTSLLQEKDQNDAGLEQAMQAIDEITNGQQKLLQDTTSQLTDIQHHLDSLLTVHT
ncbi:hypothetical protein FOL47_008186 [Perkinsus chesapeaki]|uniref:Uncharacterized protein n=1 Tax=Perkinsus chesapeaki TaxID=330153 RepID=A0A7J6MUB0_PERCH|nr:hypothetical protein FOL47_008186 [Perkinsus chesapeaki]